MKKSGLADSPFFKPVQNKAAKPTATIFETERISERNSARTEKRTPSLPKKRRTTRYSFEFYDDQIVKIKRLKFEAEQTGQKITLSDIARQALDDYLKDK
jgi:hypothetical protein